MRTAGLALGLGSFVLAGCSAAPEPEPSPVVIQIEDVRDMAQSDYYQVGSPVVGTTDQFGSRLTITFRVTNANGTIFNPRAVVHLADGTTFECQETDLRRRPSLVATLTDWDLPCSSPLPEDVTGVSVAVFDDYA